MKIYGSSWGSNYTVNSYGDIVDSSGYRTGFVLRGNEILSDSNYKTVGWLYSGGSVGYANDYYGNKPFSRWEN